MEGNQRDFGIGGNIRMNHRLPDQDERRDQDQRAGGGKTVVDDMRKTGSTGGGRAAHGRDGRGHRGADVHADDQRGALAEIDRAGMDCDQRRGDTGARRLRDDRNHNAEQNQLDATRPVISRQQLHVDDMSVSGRGLLQQVDADKNQAEAGRCKADFCYSAAGEESHHDPGEYQWQQQAADLELEGRAAPPSSR